MGNNNSMSSNATLTKIIRYVDGVATAQEHAEIKRALEAEGTNTIKEIYNTVAANKNIMNALRSGNQQNGKG
jgi:hypothetical protein